MHRRYGPGPTWTSLYNCIRTHSQASNRNSLFIGLTGLCEKTASAKETKYHVPLQTTRIPWFLLVNGSPVTCLGIAQMPSSELLGERNNILLLEVEAPSVGAKFKMPADLKNMPQIAWETLGDIPNVLTWNCNAWKCCKPPTSGPVIECCNTLRSMRLTVTCDTLNDFMRKRRKVVGKGIAKENLGA